MINEIRVTCESPDFLGLDEMTEFQGGLKNRSERDYEMIAGSIMRHGIAFPFFVWQDNGVNYVLDGHGRLGALIRERERGEQIPPLTME